MNQESILKQTTQMIENKNKKTTTKRFSIIETEKWKDMFIYSTAKEAEELTNESTYNNSTIKRQSHIQPKLCVEIGLTDISEIDSIDDEYNYYLTNINNTNNSNTTTNNNNINEEDAQWREIFGCNETHRNRVVSAPLPVNTEKINGFLKRKSDPVKLPSSSRRSTIVETGAWKDMFLCDDSKVNLRSSASTEPLNVEDENWRDFFGCNENLPHISSPRSPPLKTRPNQKLQNTLNSSPLILAPITERDSETGSSNSSGEKRPSKILGYLTSFIKSRPSKKH